MSKVSVKMITVWGDPTELMDSQYGWVSYREWCMRERMRIGLSGKTTQIITNGKLIALSH